MKMLTFGAAAAALLAMPLAAQQGGQNKTRQAGTPHTVHSELILYENTSYNGREWVVEDPSSSVRTDWNIKSIAIHPGDRWQICARPRFRNPCIILDRSVHDATMIGVEGQIGSARLARETPSPS